MPLLPKAEFLRTYRHTAEEFSATGLDWNDLKRVYSQQEGAIGNLLPTGTLVAETILLCPAVHTVGSRVKEPEHLVDKIVRKSKETKTIWATSANYKKVVTDLIGARGLYLFNDEWPRINAHILNSWSLKKRPEANVRKGDPEEYKKMFDEGGCRVIERTTGYRSIHYLAKVRATKTEQIVEIQIRSLFEQAASEVDHKVRYPSFTDDSELAALATNVHRIAALGDEMSIMARCQMDYLKIRRARGPVGIAEAALGILERKIAHVDSLYRELFSAGTPVASPRKGRW